MGSRAGPLLECRPVFHSRDVDETRAWLNSKEFRFEPIGRRVGQPDVRMNGVYLPNMYLGYLQYGVQAMIRAAPARNDYWIQLPIRGALAARSGRHEVDCSPRRAVVQSPTRDDYYFMRSDADGARVHVCINQVALMRQLAALLGEPVECPIEFDSALPTTAGYGRSIAGYLLTAITDLEQPDSTLQHAAMSTMFEQFVITRLLLSHPHTESERLRKCKGSISPRDVKRAIDYMEANLAGPMILADVVDAAGVPGRTLFQHFRDWKGTSPMRYMRNARFQRAHEALRQAPPDTRIADVAASCGFGHIGRFSVEYRERFGESPSDTLQRRR